MTGNRDTQLSCSARSQFTYKDLDRLGKGSVETPLRVIAHIDLDAFYAQCETVRLGLDESVPLAVQQWGNLIAINYPARAHGLNSRHVSAAEALKICPTLRLVHIATWSPGDTHWSYRDPPAVEKPPTAEASTNTSTDGTTDPTTTIPAPAWHDIATHKACLDPYRIQSRKILRIFRRHCPKTEKASIDESFLDLSELVYARLLQQYSALLQGPPPYDDPSEYLPLPPQPTDEGVDWHGSNIIELDEGDDDAAIDWDDVAMTIGTGIVAEIRKEVREKLRYTCSAGIASNKMLAKLASGFKKPNNQTVVRRRAIGVFLSGIELTKIRNFGGKLGAEIANTLSTTNIPTLLTLPMTTLCQKLPAQTAHWLYHTIRGVDKNPVDNGRQAVKSMLSAKSFRPYINKHEDAVAWLRIFVADICGRMREEEEEVKELASSDRSEFAGSVIRRPKSMSLSYRGSGRAGQMGGKSRGCPIPMGGGELTEEVMMGLAEGLLRQIESEGKAYPCAGLSLQVAGFEEREVAGKNGGIMGFLVRGGAKSASEKRVVNSGQGGESVEDANNEERRKRRKVEWDMEDGIDELDDEGVDDTDNHRQSDYDEHQSCQSRGPTDTDPGNPTSNSLLSLPSPPLPPALSSKSKNTTLPPRFFTNNTSSSPQKPPPHPLNHNLDPSIHPSSPTLPLYTCSQCQTSFPASQADILSHEDWHFAKNLVEEERRERREAAEREEARKSVGVGVGRGGKIGQGRGGRGGKRGGGGSGSGGGKVEKGQRKLEF